MKSSPNFEAKADEIVYICFGLREPNELNPYAAIV